MAAFVIAARRKRISRQDARQFLEDLDVLPIRIETMTQKLLRLHILPLAEAHNLTIYDAAYLELAMRQTASLATFDDDLRKASHASGVHLLTEPQP
ncbi:MAG: type II toxin-antitoxin system VapC family toxin [Terriglobia bacterium]